MRRTGVFEGQVWLAECFWVKYLCLSESIAFRYIDIERMDLCFKNRDMILENVF